MKKKTLGIFLIFFVFSLNSCVTGLIYTDTTEPYCTNMDDTPVSSEISNQALKQISIPTIPGSAVRWDDNTISDIARRAGIKKVAYCDLKTYRILSGAWEKETLIVYGTELK